MSSAAAPQRDEIELRVLRLLCAPNLPPKVRENIAAELSAALFHEPSHQIIFEEICALLRLSSDRLRELLPARVTNRGVPEFDFDALLNGEPFNP